MPQNINKITCRICRKMLSFWNLGYNGHKKQISLTRKKVIDFISDINELKQIQSKKW